MLQGPEDTNVLPPNFYKIPMRVLLTQVYDGGEASGRAREVYCKVVPPEYIRRLYDEDSEPQISKLNTALSSLAMDYVRYREAAIEFGEPRDIPPFGIDFTTDFSRDHNSDSSLDFDSRKQYCSIESLYSKVFHHYKSPVYMDAVIHFELDLYAFKFNLFRIV